MKEYRHIFGPVPSRRFGRSLGIDLTPFKTCSMDCVFCQLGRTTQKTASRAEFVPLRDVIAELDDWLRSCGEADFMTLAGSGEPTLHTRFGDVIEFARAKADIRSALLTNGTTLHIPEVKSAASRADVVKVSLSAWDQKSMEDINRPCAAIGFDGLLKGMRMFRSQYKGELWMEVFFVPGINDSNESARRIAEVAETVSPDRIHLNTAVRPPSEKSVAPLTRERLGELAEIFGPAAEVIADFKSREARVRADSAMILATLRRRPCTGKQIEGVFAMHPNEVSKHMGALMARGLVRSERNGAEVFYVAEG